MRGAIAIVVLVSGCEAVTGDFEVSALVGDWESEGTFQGKKIEAHFFGDETGDVNLPTPISLTELVVVHADATWRAVDDDDFRVVLVCDDATLCPESVPKADRTFTVNCRARSNGESLSCRGVRADDPPFELVRSKE